MIYLDFPSDGTDMWTVEVLVCNRCVSMGYNYRETIMPVFWVRTDDHNTSTQKVCKYGAIPYILITLFYKTG